MMFLLFLQEPFCHLLFSLWPTGICSCSDAQCGAAFYTSHICWRHRQPTDHHTQPPVCPRTGRGQHHRVHRLENPAAHPGSSQLRWILPTEMKDKETGQEKSFGLLGQRKLHRNSHFSHRSPVFLLYWVLCWGRGNHPLCVVCCPDIG